jgi:hypothetical protein
MSDTLPALLCVLQHWAGCKIVNDTSGDMDHRSRRHNSARAMNMMMRRRGFEGLRANILSGMKGEQSLEPVHLLLGAGLLYGDVLVETSVRQCLKHQMLPFRLAATFSASYYIATSEEISSLLTERVVLAEGPPLLVQASREALAIGSSARAGRCSRCGLTSTSPWTQKLQAWELPRASSKSRS